MTMMLAPSKAMLARRGASATRTSSRTREARRSAAPRRRRSVRSADRRSDAASWRAQSPPTQRARRRPEDARGTSRTPQLTRSRRAARSSSNGRRRARAESARLVSRAVPRPTCRRREPLGRSRRSDVSPPSRRAFRQASALLHALMPKMKTHSGAKKRFKLTANGKVRRVTPSPATSLRRSRRSASASSPGR